MNLKIVFYIIFGLTTTKTSFLLLQYIEKYLDKIISLNKYYYIKFSFRILFSASKNMKIN